ncbi:MAG TPA: hypothetical protein VGM87_13355 [Roseomonas sp.]|jgi:hypothetical protein
MIMDVLKRQPSGYQLLGRCDVPALSSDFVEVIASGDQWSPLSRRERPSGHRFRVVRTTRAGGGIALVPYEDARPDVLPGWTPAAGRRGR